MSGYLTHQNIIRIRHNVKGRPGLYNIVHSVYILSISDSSRESAATVPRDGQFLTKGRIIDGRFTLKCRFNSNPELCGDGLWPIRQRALPRRRWFMVVQSRVMEGSRTHTPALIVFRNKTSQVVDTIERAAKARGIRCWKDAQNIPIASHSGTSLLFSSTTSTRD